MANTITKTTVVDGPKHLIVLVNIAGDNSGDETGAILVDRSAFAPTDGTELTVTKVHGYLAGFTANLRFDATADLVFARLPDADYFCYDWSNFGGIGSGLSGAGVNGDILIATTGLASEFGTFVIEMRKS